MLQAITYQTSLSLVVTLLDGFIQSNYLDRHLGHHAGQRRTCHLTPADKLLVVS